jgi:hypothetical protein
MSITPHINPDLLSSSPFTPALNQARCTTTCSNNENNYTDRRERRGDRINDNDSTQFKAYASPWQTRVPPSSANASGSDYTVLGELTFARTD